MNPVVIDINENGLELLIVCSHEHPAQLRRLAPPLPATPPPDLEACFHLVELQATGAGKHPRPAGSHHVSGHPGALLTYRAHADKRNAHGRKLEIVQEHDGTAVISHLQFYNHLPVLRSWTEIVREQPGTVSLEYVSSFCVTGLGDTRNGQYEHKARLWVPYSSCLAEARWQSHRLSELGWPLMTESSARLSYAVTGTQTCNGYLPMGVWQDEALDTTLAWEIESTVSWQWELATSGYHLALNVSGPTHNENLWWKRLNQGERFCSVPVVVTAVTGNMDDAMAALTRFRRHVRRSHPDNVRLPVIFNDYMNCLFGDPTTEKLLPLIRAAAELGCEYFVIDAGWYADGSWHADVGEWLPSNRRFPNGIEEPLAAIRERGMVPGLWLELEVMGTQCRLANTLPDACFFQLHGARQVYSGRYQLDFRHPEVRRFADGVVDRLVRQYGIGYIKMDYNIDAGPGTDHAADSLGDGLLEHSRAYLTWLDAVLDRYPELVIENCSSGGGRMCAAMLRRHSLQSNTDQTDYRKYAYIAAASPSAVTPEQCGNWCYPLRDADGEAIAFNLVNGMLMRIFQSGHVACLNDAQKAALRQGLDYYKTIRGRIPLGIPFWPLGLPHYPADWLCLGLDCGETVYLAVWRMDTSQASCNIPLHRLADRVISASIGFPSGNPAAASWNRRDAVLNVSLPQPFSARIVELTTEGAL